MSDSLSSSSSSSPPLQSIGTLPSSSSIFARHPTTTNNEPWRSDLHFPSSSSRPPVPSLPTTTTTTTTTNKKDVWRQSPPNSTATTTTTTPDIPTIQGSWTNIPPLVQSAITTLHAQHQQLMKENKALRKRIERLEQTLPSMEIADTRQQRTMLESAVKDVKSISKTFEASRASFLRRAEESEERARLMLQRMEDCLAQQQQQSKLPEFNDLVRRLVRSEEFRNAMTIELQRRNMDLLRTQDFHSTVTNIIESRTTTENGLSLHGDEFRLAIDRLQNSVNRTVNITKRVDALEVFKTNMTARLHVMENSRRTRDARNAQAITLLRKLALKE